jgi:hypothetical protein
MKWIVVILKVFCLTFIFGVIYFAIKYLIDAPTGTNMYDVGAFFVSALYSIANVVFVFIVFLTNQLICKRLKDLIFSFKYLIVEIFSLYFLFEVFTYVYNKISILPLDSSTGKDTFQVLTPFVFIYTSWLIIVIACKCKRRNNSGDPSFFCRDKAN